MSHPSSHPDIPATTPAPSPDDATPPHRLGIDIGGTRLKAGIIGPDGQPLATATAETPVDSRPPRVVETGVALVDELCHELGIERGDLPGLGVGLPGLLDVEAGVARAVVNLRDWHDVPLSAMLNEATGLTTTLENDANAAAFGEYTAARRDDPTLDHLAMLTLGTGVGAGLVLDGRVFHGSALAGEIGHGVIDPEGEPCACGQRGCLETIASATAVVREARRALAQPHAPGSSLAAMDPGTLTAKAVFDAAREGDALAGRIAQGACDALALTCVNLCRVLDLQHIVLGGGVAQAGEPLRRRVEEAYRQLTWTISDRHPVIALSTLGNHAGFIGAAALSALPRGSSRRAAP